MRLAYRVCLRRFHTSTHGKTDATELAQLVRSKLGPIYRWKYLPDNPDRLFDALEITNARERKACVEVAKQFIDSLSSATLDERMFVFHAFTNKCPHDALTDPHVILDYLRRTLEKTSDEVVAVAKGLSPLGFVSRVEGHGDAEDVLHFRWVARMTFVHEFLQEYAASMSTKIALEMIDSALPHLCDDCMAGLASHLDFTALDEGAGGRIVLAEDWWQNVLSDPD